MKNKKIILPLFAVFAAALYLLFFQACTKQADKVDDLNILLITLDTTRSDYIGAYGHGSIKTPHIDELCNKGVMFQNCYSPVPLTLPAHCSIFTGKYSIGHGVRSNSSFHLIKSESTLTRLVKEQGYHTYAVIAAYVLLAKFGLNQGFDIYDDTFSTAEIPANVVYKKFKSWFVSNSDKKFFSWVHFYDPHEPYAPPAGYIEKGSENDDRKRYAGEIEYVDTFIGKITADLKSAGILKKTLLIIAGDHGEAFGEHNEYGHTIFCYEENLRVPLVFYNEALFEKKSIRQRVNLVDIMPTVLELLGMPVPGDVQGKSCLPLMRGFREETDRAFYIESLYGNEEFNWASLTGIIAGDYKYISLPEPELYNLSRDKGEQDNIFKKEYNVARKYDERLKDLILKLSDPVSGEKVRHRLSDKDVRNLKSLGYISAFSSKSGENSPTDPKVGIIIKNKLDRFSEQVKVGKELEQIESELKKLLIEADELKSPLVYSLLFDIYKKRKDYRLALKILEQGIGEFPNIYRFRYRLAAFLFELKKYDETTAQCRIILQQNPLSAQAYALLGNVYFQQGNINETLKNFREAVQLEPDNVPVKMKYADVLAKNKRYNEAVEIYNTLLDADETAKNQGFLFNVAILNTRYGTIETAEKIFHRLTDIQPSGNYFFYYAIALSKNGKFQEAVKNMKTALNEYPGDLTPGQKQQANNAVRMWRNRY